MLFFFLGGQVVAGPALALVTPVGPKAHERLCRMTENGRCPFMEDRPSGQSDEEQAARCLFHFKGCLASCPDFTLHLDGLFQPNTCVATVAGPTHEAPSASLVAQLLPTDPPGPESPPPRAIL